MALPVDVLLLTTVQPEEQLRAPPAPTPTASDIEVAQSAAIDNRGGTGTQSHSPAYIREEDVVPRSPLGAWAVDQERLLGLRPSSSPRGEGASSAAPPCDASTPWLHDVVLPCQPAIQLPSGRPVAVLGGA